MRAMTLLLSLYMLSAQGAIGQTVEVSAKPLTDSDIQLLRSNVQSGKVKVIADTMRFDDPESKAFWPLYRDFARDQQVIGDKLVQLIQDFAAHYENMDNATAQKLVERMLDIEGETTGLRKNYWPKFEAALGGKRAAQFYQVDARLSLMVNLELTSAIPLVE